MPARHVIYVDRLTVPVLTRGQRDQRIDEVRIDHMSDFPTKHFCILMHAYARALFYHELSLPLSRCILDCAP